MDKAAFRPDVYLKKNHKMIEFDVAEIRKYFTLSLSIKLGMLQHFLVKINFLPMNLIKKKCKFKVDLVSTFNFRDFALREQLIPVLLLL